MDLLDLIGFAGAAVVLAAFALTNARSVRVSSKTLAVMNLGGGALALHGLVHHAWPSVVVNTVWFVIAVIALVRARVPRTARNRDSVSRISRNRGSYAGAALVELEHGRRGCENPRIVRGGQDRAPRGHLLAQHPDHPVDRGLVLLRCRLVHQQQRRRGDQRPRNRRPLSLPAGEKLHRLVEQSGQGQPVGQLVDGRLAPPRSTRSPLTPGCRR